MLVGALFEVEISPPALSASGRFAQDAKGAKFTENFFLFLFADPGGIGSAFHRAGKAKRNKPRPFGQDLFLSGLPEA